jgi:uncharacterized membrane protein (DUF4010 family)
MITAPAPISVGLLLGLSFFLGLAFEDFFARSDIRHPGGIRTFPMLALAGGVLYLFDSAHFIPFTGGLLALGAWLAIYYWELLREPDEGREEANVGLVILVLNVQAYLLGAVALALPPWVAVATTVTSVLLLTGREQLHNLARRIEIKEIITAGQFLVLTGIILPLLPSEPVTTLTSITPRQAWLALIAVCSISYASYLAQRYWAPKAGALWMAALGGLYSSTAATVALARQAGSGDGAGDGELQAGITLASGIMYVRILAIVAVFNGTLAWRVAPPLCGLSLVALLICALQYSRARRASPQQMRTKPPPIGGNPLALGSAALFSALFILVSLLSTWVKSQFGVSGLYSLAAVVGITDVDPFVLNLAQGGASGTPAETLAAAILIAASSNNILKAAYAAIFAGRRAVAGSAAALVFLALVGVAVALMIGGV